ncbi:MAG: beta family protein [Acidobacteriota bacterium]
MFGAKHYVPILKGKRGELGALHVLSDKTKNTLTPLIDIPRVTLVYPQKEPKHTLEKHLESVAKNILRSWGNMRRVFVDLSEFELLDRTSMGDHPLTYFFNLLREHSIQAIPTTGLDRDLRYNDALASVLARDRLGAMIRVREEDIGSPQKLNAELDELLRSIAVNRRSAHLLLDFGAIGQKNIRSLAKLAICTINQLSEVSQWQSLTLASSGLPETMSEVQSGGKTPVDRLELKLWRSVIGQSNGIARVPTFGDYGVVHPDFVDQDPRAISPSAKIRYTLEDQWLIIKGRSLKRYKYAQYHTLAGLLVAERGYRGRGFSWGDSYVADCAVQACGPGNLQTWVTVDTSHHLTLVAEQISNERAV